MMYNNKLVAALKVGGKILREFKDTVYIPFGAEYSILIKNLNTVRTAVDISIDGTDATEGVSLIVNPKEEFELTRYIKNGNLDSGNRFKFIERTSGIEQHRGIGVEDGIIRIEFQFEQPHQPINIAPFWGWNNSYDHKPRYKSTGDYTIGDQPYSVSRSISSNAIYCADPSLTGNVSVQSFAANSVSVNDAGITVPGSISNQQFQSVSGFCRESTRHSMILRLLGETEQGPIVQPVLVKTKPTCQTCGRVNKAGAKFCTNCGTSLQIV